MTTSTYGAVTAQVREGRGKGAARTLRRSGRVPVVMYGAGGENRTLSIDPNEFRKATDPERSWNTLFQVTIEENGKSGATQPCMIADIHVDAVKRTVMHVDFMRVDPEEEIIRKIPVEYVGRSEGVVKGGKLKRFRRHVKVGCKPGHIPVKLTVDVSPVDTGQSIRMKDVSLDNARLVEHPEARLVLVEMPKARPEDEVEGDDKDKDKDKDKAKEKEKK